MTAVAAAAAPPEARVGTAFVAALDDSLDPNRQGDDELAALWAALRATAEGGGRMRPALVIAAHRAFEGANLTAAQHVADAVELLHTAFLCHDDVLDHDTWRRGHPNVNGRFSMRALARGTDAASAEAYGAAAGLLAGDLALVGATRLFATTPAPPAVVTKLLDLLDAAVARSTAGELADVRATLRVEHPGLDRALLTAEHKTAAYSFCLPLCAGGVLAGARAKDLGQVNQVGRHLGLAFQLHDDLIGVFGDSAATGKSTLSDLREGKVTPLIAHARTTSAWPSIRARFGDPTLTEVDARRLRTALEDCGSRSFVEDLVDAELQTALTLADAVGLRSQLAWWAATLTGRSL